MSRPIVLLGLALAACDGALPSNQLDLLFVVDDSGSTREEQLALATAVPALLGHLERRPGGLPDIHVAVVTTDMGAGPTPLAGNCRPLGYRGTFQVRPGCGLDPATGSFLRARGEMVNFTGTLADSVGCLVQLGSGGCGFEHQLMSMRAALTRPVLNATNLNFVRPNALLAVVILSDEDDCSGEPTATFFEGMLPGQGLSLRCATLGHLCNGQPVPAQADFRAPLSGCEPYQRTAAERDTRLVGVPEFVEFLKGIKYRQEERIFVGAMIGWDEAATAEYRIVAGPTGELQLRSICDSPALGSAAPAIRLRAFARSFPHHAVHTLCGNDLMAAMDDIGRKLAAALP